MWNIAKRRPRIVGGLALVLLLAIGAAAMAFWPERLPHPAQANREELLRWVVTRDLADEPHDLRATLAERLVEQFGEGLDWGEADRRLGNHHRQRLLENIPLLIGPWLAQKAERFAAAGPSERTALLDRTIKSIRQWRRAASLAVAGSDEQHLTLQPTEQIMAETHKIFSDAPPNERERIEQFLGYLQARWAWQALSTTLGGGTSDEDR